MPLTQLELPILARFLCVVEMTTGRPTLPEQDEKEDAKPLPKGVVLGPDGKPCRTCTSGAQWRAMMSKSTSPFVAAATTTMTKPATLPAPSTTDDCPPDVEALGRSSWTLLHSLTGAYPASPSAERQSETKQFLSLFSRLYPCWVCADDFQAWMRRNEPRVSNREEFGRWMCEAHNAVNVKLGKERFDCARWEERWRTGWKDGRCD